MTNETISFPELRSPVQDEIPALIVDGKQWKGFRCGIAKRAELVFRDEPEWDRFWKAAMAPYEDRLQATPEVDFEKEMVVGVFRGEQSYAAYEIEIVAIERADARDLGAGVLVRYQNVERLIGIASRRYPVYPYHLKKISLFGGPVLFSESR